jgi:hypothetical protein
MFPAIPPLTQTLIILNVTVFLAQMLLGNWIVTTIRPVAPAVVQRI